MPTRKPTELFRQQVSDRLGVLPNFFISVGAVPGLIEELWGFAQSAYLDNPLPALAKERLFVYLSRFCPVRYCLVRHVGFLMGLGRPAGDANVQPQTLEQVTELLSRALPDSAKLNEALARLESGPMSAAMPEVNSSDEADLFEALSVIFLEPRLSGRAREGVRRAYGDTNFELLTACLAFIRTAHYWTETHPELAYEPDVVALMEAHPALARLLLDPSEAERLPPEETLRQALVSLPAVQETMRQSQQRDSFLLQLSDTLRPLAKAEQIRLTAAQLLGQHLGASRVAYAEHAPDGDYFKVTQNYVDGAANVVGHLRYTDFGPDIVAELQTGRTRIQPDINQDSRLTDAQKQALAQVGVVASLNVPLVKNGQLVAFLGVNYAVVHAFGPAELALVGEVAERTWAAVERAKAEEALKQRKKELARVQEIGHIGGVAIDIANNLTGVRSPEYLRLHGLPPDTKTETHEDWLRRLHPDDRAQAEQTLFSALRNNQSTYESEYRILRPDDGRLVWIYAKLDIERDTAGKPLRLVGVHIDVTSRKLAEKVLRESEERKEFLLKLTDTIRQLNDPVAIQYEAARLVAEQLNADRVHFAEISEDKKVVIHKDYVRGDAPSLAGIFDTKVIAAAVQLDRDEPVVIADTQAFSLLSDEEKATLAAARIRSQLSVALSRMGKKVASFSVDQTTPRDWKPLEISILQEAAERTLAAVEKANAEEALRKNEEKYRTLFDSIDEGFCIIERVAGEPLDFRYLEANPAFTTHLGVRDVIGKTIREVFPSELQEGFDLYDRVLNSRESIRFERVLVANGRVLELYAFPVAGQPEQLAVVFNDITGRKRHEANLAFLVEVSQDLVRLTKIDETMNALGAKIGQYINASVCGFSIIDEAAGTFTTSHAWHREGVPNQIGVFRIADFHSEEIRRASRAGEIYVVQDTATDPRTNPETMGALQVGSFITVPLVRGGRWQFNLTIVDTVPRAWREDEVALMRELTTRIWTRLERARMEEALHESEERLRLFVTSSSDVVYRMNADWSEMQHLTGKQFLMDTLASNYDWMEGYIPPDEQAGVWSQIRQAIADKRMFELEHRVIQHDGTIGRVHSRAVPLLDGQGDIVEWFGTATNVTERYRATEERRQSDERFRTLVQNLPDYAIFRLDTEGFITEWTEGAERVKGYTPDEAIGQHLALFYTPDDKAAGVPDQELAEAARTGRTEREGWRICKNGDWILVNEICTAIYDPLGQLVGYTKISRDITARKRADDALFDSRQRLQIVMDSIADHAIITSDPQGTITGWNSGAAQMFGYEADEVLGLSDDLIFTPEDRAAGAPEQERQTARQQGRAPDERYHIRRDGSHFYVSGVLSPLYDGVEQPLGYVKVARDLSDRRQMEQTLRQADQRKDEFLAMLAHELRNPLAPIRNLLQILQLTQEDEGTIAPAVAIMSRQVDHLVRLVDDLLDVSRISRGKIELRRERLDLTVIIGQAAEAAQPLYTGRNRQLHVSLPRSAGSRTAGPPSPLYVNGDATRLTQVVTNLLTNGARYTGEGGQVWLTVEAHNRQALLRVRDNGMGLAADQLQVIFELFVQVDNSLARSQGGLGLGLTLVKRLVEMHGGHVEAHSEGLGKGSEFIVVLPLLEEHKARVDTESQPTQTGDNQGRVLVVDDNRDAANTLAMLLKFKKYDVHVRYGGREALEAAEQLQPQVVLLDIGMPDLDGLATARLFRQQPWGQTLPLIALSGYGQEEDKQRSREAGFDGHLVKPVDLTELTQLLGRLLAHPPGTTQPD